MSIAKTISGDGLPMVSAENFMEVEFEEKFFFYAQQFGLAGAELVRGFALTDKDFDIPDDSTTREMVVAYEVTEPVLAKDGTDTGKTEKVTKYRKETVPLRVHDEALYRTLLQNGYRRKDEYVLNKQKLCGCLMLKLEKTLRVSVQQHEKYNESLQKGDIITLWNAVKECATGRGAQSAYIKLFTLLQLSQKSDSVSDFELYTKEFKDMVIEVTKLGTSSEILKYLFNAKYVHGLKRELFKEHLAVALSEQQWPEYEDLAELLLRVVRTNRGFSELNRARRKDTDGAIAADAMNLKGKKPRASGNFACFNCGNPDHKAGNCPDSPNVCGKCGKPGHLGRFHDTVVGLQGNGGANKNSKSVRFENARNSNEKKQFPEKKGNRKPFVKARSTNVDDDDDADDDHDDDQDDSMFYGADDVDDAAYDDEDRFMNLSTACTNVVSCSKSDDEAKLCETVANVTDVVTCSRCMSRSDDHDLMNEKFVIDSACVGDGHVVKCRKLLKSELNTRKFRIEGYDGSTKMSCVSGFVECIGDAVFVPNAPNNLLNLKKFCAEYNYVYYGDASTISVCNKSDKSSVLFTARSSGDGFFSVTYGEILSGCGSTLGRVASSAVTANTLSDHRTMDDADLIATQRCCPVQAQIDEHFSAEQIARAKEAYKLCGLLGHPGDPAVAHALQNGNFVHTHLTPQDLYAARRLFGQCMACTEGKMLAPPPQPSTSPPAVKIGEKVFVDIVYFVEGCYNSYTCALFAVDEKSSYRFIIPMKSKNLADTLEGFKTMIAGFTVYGHIVRHFVMDDERIFNAMRRPLQEMSIQATVTPAGLHNKRCERYWQTHLQRKRSISADLPYELPGYLDYHLSLWTVYTSNCVPGKQTSRTTPFEMFTGKKPFIPTFKFGQPGIFYSPRPDSDQRGEWGIFVGHRDDQLHSYLAYMPHRKEFYSRRKFVSFDTYPSEWNLQMRIRAPTSKRKIKKEEDHQFLLQKSLLTPSLPTVKSQSPLSSVPTPRSFPFVAPGIPEEYTTPSIPSPTPVVFAPPSSIPDAVPPPPAKKELMTPALAQEGASHAALPPLLSSAVPYSVDSPAPQAAPSNHKGDSTVPVVVQQKQKLPVAPKKPSTKTAPPPAVESMVSTRSSGRVSKPNSLYQDFHVELPGKNIVKSTSVVKVNRISLNQALKDPSKQDLTEASIRIEITGLLESGALKPVHITDLTKEELRENCIDGHMFLDDKYLSTGEFEKRKARLVMNGEQQHPKLVGETRAPTVNPISVQTAIARAATLLGSSIETADVVQAFLLTPMNKSKGRTFVRIRKGKLVDIMIALFPELRAFLAPDGSLLFELDSYVYGLKAAAAEFNGLIDKVFRELGFHPTEVDQCLYVKNTKYGIHTLSTHVDDVLSVAPNQKLQDQFMDQFGKKLKIKRHGGNVLSYIGLTITRNPKTGDIRLTQDHYVKELIKKFEPTGKMVESPAGSELFANNEKSSVTLNAKEKQYYQSLIMSLMYLARLTRPDILFPTTYLATKSSNPSALDLLKAKRIVKYIASAPNIGINYYSNSSMKLMIHADASHLVHPDGFGHTGIVITLGNSVVFARSVKQKMQTLSSTESEMIALQEASTYVVWMRYLLKELGYNLNSPTVVTQDNQSATVIAEQGGNFQRTKHLVGRFNFLKERIQFGDMEIKYRPSEHMPADFLTKPLPKAALKRHMTSLGVVSSFPPPSNK